MYGVETTFFGRPLVSDGPFTHLNRAGEAHMVDVTEKNPTIRSATVSAQVTYSREVGDLMLSGSMPKGDVLAVARVAGIAAAKKTPVLLPLAHVIGVHGASVELTASHESCTITATVRTADRTGVEMEAYTAATVAALNVIDMVKGIDRGVSIANVVLEEKTGGRSGTWRRDA